MIFPRRCPVCDEPVKPFGKLICDDCRKKLIFVDGPVCLKCGKSLDDDAKEYCHDCMSGKHLYKRGMALLEYTSVSDSIYRFKYRGRQEYAKLYGLLMAYRFGGEFKKLGVEALIPVPIHKSKYRKRGYNQAELIADELSKCTGIPVADNLVIRSRKTVPLKDLTPEERNNNLRGAFKINCNGVKLKTIVIIDDIYTTGATVDAVSALLLNAGVENIYFAALAIGRGM